MSARCLGLNKPIQPLPMKAIAILICISALPFFAKAERSLDEIVEKRDLVLSQLLEAAKSRANDGRSAAVDVRDATVRLYTFRRDSAKGDADRIKWQELIVAAEESASKDVKSRVAIGVMTPMDALLAEERLLAAEQKLAELRVAR